MKILFLCTANSCRSILSEAVFNNRAPEGLRAASAGSHPRGEVNPLALAALHRHGIPSDELTSKSIDSLAELHPDLVITVCDKAAGEACPVFFGKAIKAHWGLADPSELDASDEAVTRAFDDTLAIIGTRVAAFLALPLDRLDASALKDELARIGRLN
jgi:arsenate reductase (thioredoxin)